VYSSGAPWTGLTSCSVAWSDIGSNIMLPGNTNGTSDLTAGFAKMPWDENGNGNVYKVLSLNNAIMVYGDNGIALLKQTVIDKFPVMETNHLSNIGVAGNYSVAGNNKIHGFVDTNFDWNVITGEGIKNLGYRDYLSLLTGLIVVSFDGANNRFYISNGTLGYVFTKDGMYSTHQCVSSIGKYKRILTGFVKDNTDTKIRLRSTPFDGGVQDLKTIESVETGVVYDTTADYTINGKLSTKYDYKGDVIVGSAVTLNDRGIFTSKLTGREFRVYLESDYEAGAKFRLNNIKAKLKFSDKRNSRGRKNAG
jgi:hypothetical protein